MAWGWHEGGKGHNSRSLYGFTTREKAIESAVFNACGRQVSDEALLEPLWRSLERAGWRVRYAS